MCTGTFHFHCFLRSLHVPSCFMTDIFSPKIRWDTIWGQWKEGGVSTNDVALIWTSVSSQRFKICLYPCRHLLSILKSIIIQWLNLPLRSLKVIRLWTPDVMFRRAATCSLKGILFCCNFFTNKRDQKGHSILACSDCAWTNIYCFSPKSQLQSFSYYFHVYEEPS